MILTTGRNPQYSEPQHLLENKPFGDVFGSAFSNITRKPSFSTNGDSRSQYLIGRLSLCFQEPVLLLVARNVRDTAHTIGFGSKKPVRERATQRPTERFRLIIKNKLKVNLIPDKIHHGNIHSLSPRRDKSLLEPCSGGECSGVCATENFWILKQFFL